MFAYLYIGFLNLPNECINPWCLFKPCYQNIMSNSCVFENKHFLFSIFIVWGYQSISKCVKILVKEKTLPVILIIEVLNYFNTLFGDQSNFLKYLILFVNG